MTPLSEQPALSIGVVAIGRNEGARLHNCIQSVVGVAAFVVYVDSGSTDNSVQVARLAGCEVIELEDREPFTAARARNVGFRLLRERMPELRYVQFVDGDCELVPGWLQKALEFLNRHPDVAVACGRRRERYPERSIFNRLCDFEWNTPVGEARACGGDALVRIEAFMSVGGYRPTVIAAEDTEMCVRLRTAGWRIWRLDAEMTLHDAAITHFSQWWRRTVRTGYAFALGEHLHGTLPERHFVKESRRALLWGLLIPLACVIIGVTLGPWGWMVCLIYPVQFLRLIVRLRGPFSQRALVSCFYLLGRFPEALGQLKFMRDKMLGRQMAIIEYK